MNYPNNLAKYAGTIIKVKNKFIFKATKNKKIIEYAEFPYIDEDSKIIANNDAIQYKKNWSISNDKVKNKYIIDHNIIKIYVDSDKYFITDIDKIDDIDKYTWYIIDGYVGTMTKDVNKKRCKLYFHNFITNNKNIVHKDGDKMNNTIDNLKIANQKYNSKIKHFYHKKRKDNTTGFTGVYKNKYKNNEYYEVKGTDFMGNHIYQKYDINKYGIESAYTMACNYRDNFINESYKNFLNQ